MGRHKKGNQGLEEAAHKLTIGEKTDKKVLWHKFLARMRKLDLCDNQAMFVVLIESSKESWISRYID